MKKVEVLYTLMQSGKPVTVESMIKTLDVKQGSIMCLISALRNDFGAEIETNRDGRKVLSYQLMNADKIKIPTKAPKAAKAPKVARVAVSKTKTTVSRKAAVTDDVPTLDVEEIDSDAELASLKAELGLSESYSE
jgi:hypothetical protein